MWEAASKAVKDEEAVKQKLCDDLSQLVLVLIKCGFEVSQFHKISFESTVLNRFKKAVTPSFLDWRNSKGVWKL